MPNFLKKYSKFSLFPLLFAISLSFLFLPIEVKTCSIPSERIGPVLRKGKIIGFKVYAMHKNHFLRYIGLKRNDIVVEINERNVAYLLEDESLLKNFKQDIKKSKHIKQKTRVLKLKSRRRVFVFLQRKKLRKGSRFGADDGNRTHVFSLGS